MYLYYHLETVCFRLFSGIEDPQTIFALVVFLITLTLFIGKICFGWFASYSIYRVIIYLSNLYFSFRISEKYKACPHLCSSSVVLV